MIERNDNIDERAAWVLSRDLRAAAATLSPMEVRYLADAYYQSQADRIRASNRIRAASREGEPHAVLEWFMERSRMIEESIKGALKVFSQSTEIGSWAMSIYGIGPVISAGLIAHLDITKAPTAGHFWSFAGYDPTKRWDKGKKRPWNASLKRLCWNMSGVWVRLRGNHSKKDFYGPLYDKRKLYEIERNESGGNAAIAKEVLESGRRISDNQRSAYEAGRLPDARIDLRARRWVAKLFLAHLHWVWHEIEYGKPPPKPYIIANPDRPDHVHVVSPPNWPMR